MTKFTYDEIIQNLMRAKDEAPRDLDQFINNDSNFDLHLLELDLWEMDVIPEKSMGERMGIKLESFPEVEELEEDEIKTIVDGIVDIWSQYHCVANLPAGLPYRIAYETLLSVWNEPVTIFASGHFHFDYCDIDFDQYIKR